MREITLKELLLRKFGSIAKFSKAIGWSYRKAYEVVNGKQEPTASEMEEIANVAGIQSAEEFVHFFYPNSPHCGRWANNATKKRPEAGRA